MRVDAIKRSCLYKSGDSFTVSDAARVLASDTVCGQEVLSWMVERGDLVVGGREGFKSYWRARDVPRMRRTRFCNYDPPMKASMSHINRWLQSSMGWPSV